MSEYSINGVRLAGIAAAVPESIDDVLDKPGTEKIVSVSGVEKRRVTSVDQCTSDLCTSAALNLLKSLNWDASSVDLLILVTQTPDYVLPASAFVIHSRLGLSKNCAAFDVNLGCSGYIYGLSIAACHIQSRAARRVLVLAGDTISKVIAKDDRSVAYLFGDAGTATGLEVAEEPNPLHFVMGSDGSGVEHLKIPAGMFRTRSSELTRLPAVDQVGNIRSQENLFMNGPEIFNFTIREVPALINGLLNLAKWDKTFPDAYVFHQANHFMVQYLSKRMGLPPAKVICGLKDFGNTSSASIPLAICSELQAGFSNQKRSLVLVGFGVGFSWGAVAVTLNQVQILPVIECK